MKYTVRFYFADGDTMDLDDDFDTKEEAEDAALEAINNMTAGEEILSMMGDQEEGEDYTSCENIRYRIIKSSSRR